MKIQDKICKICVMDTTDKKISFDNGGICKYCHEHTKNFKKRVFHGNLGKRKLNSLIFEIKKSGRGKKYDCVVGVSGGVDSSYVAYLSKKLGLRPLAVHLDNGWNSKEAVKNISRLVTKLNLDLHTHVINWEEFRDLQLSYFKASVVDIEALTDHAIKATLYHVANKNNIKYILNGVNVETEGGIPDNWRYNKNDYLNIKDIHKRFGSVKLLTFPFLTLLDRFNYQILKNIQNIEILNYISYNKEKVKNFLSSRFGWEDYGVKHGESTFTKFFQEYILPIKFKIDKRKAHLSSLIRSKQITRNSAMQELNQATYTQEELRKEREFILNKWDISSDEFDAIMNKPPKSHYEYKSADKFLRNLRKIYLKFF
jgi:N-acetyl sugar amidotransferase